MAKRSARKAMKSSKSTVSTGEIVPHPREVGKHFTPSSVEQSGLGPAFFAVVIAIIALILLSIFGNNYLTGQYHRAGGDTVKLTDVTFAPFSQLSLNYTSPDGARYYGRFAGIRVFISSSPQSGLVFKDVMNRPFWDAYLVTKKIDSTALPTGSIAYRYNGTWRVVLPYFQSNYLILYPSTIATCVSHFCNSLAATFDTGEFANPYRTAYFTFGEIYNVSLFYRQANGTGIYNYSTAEWRVGYNTSTRDAALANVTYRGIYPFIPRSLVRVGFVAPSESSYRTPPAWPPGAVTIRYAYDTRER